MRVKSMLFIIAFCNVVVGTQRQVGVGREFSTIQSAMTTAIGGDSIVLYDSLNYVNSKIVYKPGVSLLSAPGHIYRIISQGVSIFGGTSVTNGYVERVWFGYGSTSLSTVRYFFEFEGTIGGWCWRECIMDSAIVSTNYDGGVKIVAALYGNVSSNRFVKCIFNGCGPIGNARNVIIDSCVSVNYPFKLERAWKLINSVCDFSGLGTSRIQIQKDSVAIRNCFIRASNNGEVISSDDANYSIYNDTIADVIIDSLGFTTCIDGLNNSCIKNVLFTRSYGSVDVDFYQHGNSYDTISNLLIKNITAYNHRFLNTVGIWSSKKIVVDSLLHISTSPKVCKVNAIDDTLRNSSFSYMPDSLNTWADTTNIKTGIRKSLLTDTLYSNVKFRYSDSVLGGARKTLLDEYSDTAKGDTIIINCKLSEWFKRNNKAYYLSPVSKFYEKNTWWVGDTAKILLLTSMDSSGAYILRDSAIVAAGQRTTLKYIADYATKYFTKVIVKGVSTNAVNVLDTTVTYSLTTENGVSGDTAIIHMVQPDHGSTSGGDTILLIDSLNTFGHSGQVTINGVQATIIDWYPGIIYITTPSNLQGEKKIIVTPAGGYPDTALFVYDNVTPMDTIFVDSLLTCWTNKYNKSSRLCVGGSYKATNNLQVALDSIKSPTRILIQKGTYIGGFTIPYNKNGTSWVEGHYYEIRGYNGMPKLSGNFVNSTVLLGGTASSYSNRPCKYWKFQKLEICNARSIDSLSAYGVNIDHGPFIMDSCYIHDNYPLKSPASNNNAGVRGHEWRKSIIRNCRFKNNGGLVGQSGTNENCTDIFPFVQYNWNSVFTSGFWFNDRTYHSNAFYCNYFDPGSYAAIECKGTSPYHSRSKNDTTKMYFKYLGNRIFMNYISGHHIGIDIAQDFQQVYNNYIENCVSGITAGFDYGSTAIAYKMVIYNNLVKSCTTATISLIHGHRNYPYTVNIDSMCYAYVFNNIVYKGLTRNTWNTDDIAVTSVPQDAFNRFDSVYIGNNLSYMQNTSNGNKQIFIGKNNVTDRMTISEYNIRYGRNSHHFLSTVPGLFTSSDSIIPNWTFVVSGDTTIGNGGIGGNHPYLPGVIIPSYIGAVDQTNSEWVGHVLGLANLGKP